MVIGILSYSWLSPWKSVRSRKLSPNLKLLVDAVRARGHTAKVLRSDLCELFYADGRFEVLYAGKKFPKVDVVLSRPSILDDLDLELTLNRHLMLMGIKMVNGYLPILRVKNKIRMLQILAHHGLPIPKTVVVKRLEFIDDAIRRVGDFPVIIKTPTGSLGKGVAIVESKRSLLSALDIIWINAHNRNILIQEYVAESQGKDLRVFVVGGRVVAAMERESAEDDFRSNMGAGGKGKRVTLSREEAKLALQAAEVFDLEISGVDLLRTKRGPLVMEVNSNPGLEGITQVTGVDVAGAMIELALGKCG